MGKKQTALQWLLNELRKPEADRYALEIIKKAKEMERQQIIDAYLKDRPKAKIAKVLNKWDKAEQYYEDTYGK